MIFWEESVLVEIPVSGNYFWNTKVVCYCFLTVLLCFAITSCLLKKIWYHTSQNFPVETIDNFGICSSIWKFIVCSGYMGKSTSPSCVYWVVTPLGSMTLSFFLLVYIFYSIIDHLRNGQNIPSLWWYILTCRCGLVWE